MPTVGENLKTWNNPDVWDRNGEQWSDTYGGSEVQWHYFLKPRLLKFLPAKDILEISPGAGRWTQFLKQECENLTVVDLSKVAIEKCKSRFAADSHLRYYVNDGKDLSMIASESADVVFSFDSLVHADQSVIESYLSQLPRILKPNGVVFLHHSNLAQYGSDNKTPKLLVKFKYCRKFLDLIGWRPFDLHMRDWSVSAEGVASYAKKVGLSCVSQEFLRWSGNRCYLDCISVFLRSENPHSKSLTRYFNQSEEHDKRIANDLARLYLAKS